MKRFHFLSKEEGVGVGIILTVIILITLSNFNQAIKRSRDNQRKVDVKNVAGAVDKYSKDFGTYPLSSDGMILACAPVTQEGKNFIYSKCSWGKDAIRDLGDLNYPAYINSLPIDPLFKSGFDYLYISNGKRYQIYASLELTDDDEYNAKILNHNLKCGTKKCNFGVASGDSPLDKSIEEYENELQTKIKK